MPESLVPKHGGYRKLLSFQKAQLIYDVTVQFCGRYVSPRSRTHDQMVQAARSGVQNIAEGSLASGTSKKTELKLTNVARASLEELRLGLRRLPAPAWALTVAARRTGASAFQGQTLRLAEGRAELGGGRAETSRDDQGRSGANRDRGPSLCQSLVVVVCL
jgi:four helix bundle protein